MMSAVLPDVIDECVLSCPLCLQEAHQPKLLPCLHVFCQLCLRNYAKQWQEKQQQQQQQQQHPISTNLKSSFEYKTNFSHSSSQSDASTGLDHHDNEIIGYDRPGVSDDGDGKRKDGDVTQRRSLERAKDRAVSPEMADFYRSRYQLRRFEAQNGAGANQAEDGYEIPEVNNTERPVSCDVGPVREVGQGDPNHGHKRSRSDLTMATGRNEVKKHERSKVGKRKSSSSLSGHVSSMVHIFESRSLEKQQQQQQPPMAKFRPKERRPGTPPRVIPLHQRLVPEYSHQMARSQSQDLTIKEAAFTALPRSISLTAHPNSSGSNSSNSNSNSNSNSSSSNSNSSSSSSSSKSDGRMLEKRESLSDHQYEIPECPRAVNTSTTSVYQLATAGPTESILRHPKPSRDGGSRTRPSDLHLAPRRTPSEHIYDEIPSLSPTDGAILRSSKDDHDLPRFRRSIRRHSSILDSYVMAAGGRLSVDIPVSTDDSNRLSQLYLRMESATSDRKSVASQRYVSMDQLRTDIRGQDVAVPDHVQSIATLIRAISTELGNLRGGEERTTAESTSVQSGPSPPPPSPPPVYMNLSARSQSLVSADLELDTAVPVYDTPSTPISPYQYLEEPLKRTDQEEAARQQSSDCQLPCPVCCRLFSLPRDLNDCPFISQLEDIVSSQKCERKTCGNCEAKDAAYKCLDCFVYLCHGCRNGHNWSMTNRRHKVMTLQQLQSGKYQADMKRSQRTFCERDHQNEAKYLCAKCKQLICSDCLVLYCNNHHTRSIDEVARRDRDFIRAKLQDLQRQQETLDGAVASLEMYQHHCITTRDQLLDQLAAHQDQVKSLIDQTFDLLRADAKEAYAAEYQNVSDVKTAVQRSVASLRHVTKFTNQLLLHGSHGNVVAVAPIVKEQLRRLEEVGPPRMTSQLEVKYVRPEVEMESVRQLCGRIAPAVTSLGGTERGANTYEFVKQNLAILVPCEEFHTKLATDNKGCRPNGLTVLPNGHLVVTDNINMKLKCFDGRGQLRWVICPNGSQTLVDPWDVTAMADGSLAVTDKGSKTVKIFGQEGQFVRAFGSHLNEPWGICTNSRQQLLVTDTELGRVFIHDSTGRLLDTIPAPGVDARFQMQCPEYIACNRMDDVVVSDFQRHCVLVYDALGRPLFTFGSKGAGLDQFHYPLGVSTDGEGNIYVVNYKNHRITVISGNGSLICCLTTQPAMTSMQALAIDHQRRLLVIDGSKLKVFPLPARIAAADDDVTNGDKPMARSDMLILKNDDDDAGDGDDDGGDADKILLKETTV